MTCDISGCLTCGQGYYLINKSCYSDLFLPEGYIMSSNVPVVKPDFVLSCYDANCKVCKNYARICAVCKDGYSLWNSSICGVTLIAKFSNVPQYMKSADVDLLIEFLPSLPSITIDNTMISSLFISQMSQSNKLTLQKLDGKGSSVNLSHKDLERVSSNKLRLRLQTSRLSSMSR